MHNAAPDAGAAPGRSKPGTAAHSYVSPTCISSDVHLGAPPAAGAPAAGWTERPADPSAASNSLATECTVAGLHSVSPHLVSRFTIRHAGRVRGLLFKVSVQSDGKIQYGNVVDVGNGTYTALFCGERERSPAARLPRARPPTG